MVEKPIISESVERVTLCEDELVLAGDPSGVWLVREHGSGVRYYTELYFKTEGIVPTHAIEVASTTPPSSPRWRRAWAVRSYRGPRAPVGCRCMISVRNSCVGSTR